MVATVTRDAADIDGLRARVRGEVITPADAPYSEASTVWNGAFQRRPAVIVRPARTSDVVEAVRFARQHDLPLAVRSGGHGFAGHGSVEGGLVIDVSALRDIRIDPVQRVVWVQPGVTSAELAPRTLQHGLVLSTGDVGSVGISGLTLGGGIGWMVRSHGLTIDSLEAVELVTADGRVVVASADQNPDLFWALRGGGGNFGVVTGMRFRLHELGPTIVGGLIAYRATARALRAYFEAATAAPEELTTQVMMFPAPPAPFVPPEMVGTPLLAVMLVWSGDPEAGHAAVAPFRALDGEPALDLSGEMPYPAIYDFTAEGDIYGRRHFLRSAFLDEVDDRLIAAALEAIATPGMMVQFRVLGGAMARVPADATAFAHRERPYVAVVEGTPMEPGSEPGVRAAFEAMWLAIAARAHGVYSNFLSDDGQARILEAYPPRTYARLVEVKRKYDPENVFRSNVNISPAGE